VSNLVFLLHVQGVLDNWDEVLQLLKASSDRNDAGEHTYENEGDAVLASQPVWVAVGYHAVIKIIINEWNMQKNALTVRMWNKI